MKRCAMEQAYFENFTRLRKLMVDRIEKLLGSS